MAMKRDTTIASMICVMLALPACKNDEGTRVPETQTPYMEEPDELPPEEDDELGEEPPSGEPGGLESRASASGM